nr:hypothetical protein [Paenibacillus popilliae]
MSDKEKFEGLIQKKVETIRVSRPITITSRLAVRRSSGMRY